MPVEFSWVQVELWQKIDGLKYLGFCLSTNEKVWRKSLDHRQTGTKFICCWLRFIYRVLILFSFYYDSPTDCVIHVLSHHWILIVIKFLKLAAVSVLSSQIAASAGPTRRHHRPLCLPMSADLSTRAQKPNNEASKGSRGEKNADPAGWRKTHSPFVPSAFPIPVVSL